LESESDHSARYSHGTRDSHALAVKRILQYLKGTSDKELFSNLTEKTKLIVTLIQILLVSLELKMDSNLFVQNQALDM
jgi:hypothetical protein